MKYNADVNLRQRARRKWFILLGCAAVAGGLWFRADMKKKQAASRYAPPPEPAAAGTLAAESPNGSNPQWLDEAVETPFVAPEVAFEDAQPIGGEGLGRADFSLLGHFGLTAMSASDGSGFGFGSMSERTGVAISVSDRAPVTVTIGPEVTDLDRPQAPKTPSIPAKVGRLPQTLPRQ